MADLARSYLNGELSFPDLPDSKPEVRAVVLGNVPEAQPFVEAAEQGSGGWASLGDYVWSLGDVLWPALEEGRDDLARRCLLAADELLGNSSTFVQELVVEQIVEGVAHCYPGARVLCGPRALALLENQDVRVDGTL